MLTNMKGEANEIIFQEVIDLHSSDINLYNGD